MVQGAGDTALIGGVEVPQPCLGEIGECLTGPGRALVCQAQLVEGLGLASGVIQRPVDSSGFVSQLTCRLVVAGLLVHGAERQRRLRDPGRVGQVAAGLQGPGVCCDRLVPVPPDLHEVGQHMGQVGALGLPCVPARVLCGLQDVAPLRFQPAGRVFLGAHWGLAAGPPAPLGGCVYLDRGSARRRPCRCGTERSSGGRRASHPADTQPAGGEAHRPARRAGQAPVRTRSAPGWPPGAPLRDCPASAQSSRRGCRPAPGRARARSLPAAAWLRDRSRRSWPDRPLAGAAGGTGVHRPSRGRRRARSPPAPGPLRAIADRLPQ